MHHDFIENRQGQRLFYRSLVSKKSPGRLIVLFHGFAEHSGRYTEIMEKFHQEGCSVFAFDMRGHGYSFGMRGQIGHFDEYLEDAHEIFMHALKVTGKKNALLVAHSMGGLVGAHFAAKYPELVSSLVLSSPLMGMHQNLPFWKKGAGLLLSKLAPNMALSGDIKGSQLSHDSVMAARYDEDPLIYKYARSGWFGEIVKAINELPKSAKTLKMPLLMQLAGKDVVVDRAASETWFSSCNTSDKTKIIYDDFYHEIYNEKERAKPISDLVEWVSAHA